MYDIKLFITSSFCRLATTTIHSHCTWILLNVCVFLLLGAQRQTGPAPQPSGLPATPQQQSHYHQPQIQQQMSAPSGVPSQQQQQQQQPQLINGPSESQEEQR